MTIQRMEHAGIVVDNFAAAMAFFVELGLELTKFHTSAGRGGDPCAPANALGIRHVTFAVQGIDDVLDRLRAHGAELVGELEQYENSYRICYVRGPEGIIIELAEQIERPVGERPSAGIVAATMVSLPAGRLGDR